MNDSAGITSLTAGSGPVVVSFFLHDRERLEFAGTSGFAAYRFAAATSEGWIAGGLRRLDKRQRLGQRCRVAGMKLDVVTAGGICVEAGRSQSRPQRPPLPLRSRGPRASWIDGACLDAAIRAQFH